MREHVSVTTPEGTTSTESVWDGQTLIAERDSDGTLYRYVWGPDGSPLSIVRTRPGAADERFSYHTDALGSVVAITSEGGGVVATYRYGAFGELVSVGGTNAELAARNPLRYRAYYYDTHSALYYLPARYYDPASARFLSPDPAPASAGDPRTLDRYMYCTGDPVNYYDPTGAYLDAGGGASRVSEAAVELARSGRLEDAKAVQAAYRATVTSSYADGKTYDEAQTAARRAALAEREKMGDGRENAGDGVYSDPIAPAGAGVSAGQALPVDTSREIVIGILGGQTQLLLWGGGFLVGGAYLFGTGLRACFVPGGALAGGTMMFVGVQFMISGGIMIGGATKSMGVW